MTGSLLKSCSFERHETGNSVQPFADPGSWSEDVLQSSRNVSSPPSVAEVVAAMQQQQLLIGIKTNE